MIVSQIHCSTVALSKPTALRAFYVATKESVTNAAIIHVQEKKDLPRNDCYSSDCEGKGFQGIACVKVHCNYRRSIPGKSTNGCIKRAIQLFCVAIGPL